MPFRSTFYTNYVMVRATHMGGISTCGIMRLDSCLEWQAVRQEQQQKRQQHGSFAERHLKMYLCLNVVIIYIRWLMEVQMFQLYPTYPSHYFSPFPIIPILLNCWSVFAIYTFHSFGIFNRFSRFLLLYSPY